MVVIQMVKKNIINATAYRPDYKECFPNREAPISVIFEPTKTTIGGIAYLATAVVRIKDGKQYLYDIINIKKEASTPL